ncbi:hypothetical protein S40293_02561 [Stachybotrys chartarum IBT 40293]|nr:hypothetical protein S40293_02561 [Stachybotrys chartarum IBT 40293]
MKGVTPAAVVANQDKPLHQFSFSPHMIAPSETPPSGDEKKKISSTEDRVQQRAGPPPPPNGGYGWVCAAAVATINAHTWGMNSSYGVFLAHYLANDLYPGASPLEYAFIGSLSIGCALGISPLVTASVRIWGTKRVMLVGALLEGLSLVAASFAHRIWQLFLAQGVLFGLGMGLLFVPSAGIVPQWFTTRRSLASGLTTSGSGLGGLVYSFATGAMIQNLGLSWTFRILGIIAFVVNATCTLLVKDRNKIIGSKQIAFDTTLFRRAEYLLLLAFGWFAILGYVVLVYSLSSYANYIGLDASQAALVTAFMNLGQAFGRPAVGFFSDRTGRLNMATAATLLAGIFTLAIWVNATSYGVLIFFAIVGGAVGGSFWTVVAPVTAEIVGLRDVPSALSLMWISIVLPATFSEPIALEIVVGTGSYLGAQLFAGFMFIAATACLIMLRGWKIGEVNEAMRVTNQTLEKFDQVAFENDDELTAQCRKAGRKKMAAMSVKWCKV